MSGPHWVTPERQDELGRFAVLRLTAASMLVALTFLVEMLPTVPGPDLKFVGFTIILSGLILGPVTGAMVGGVGDLLGFLAHPSGAFFPGFTLTSALTGALPGLFLNRVKLTEINPWLGRFYLLLAIGVTQLLTSVLMVSYFTSFLVGLPFELELARRLPAQVLHVPLYALGAHWLIHGLEAHGGIYTKFWAIRR